MSHSAFIPSEGGVSSEAKRVAELLGALSHDGIVFLRNAPWEGDCNGYVVRFATLDARDRFIAAVPGAETWNP